MPSTQLAVTNSSIAEYLSTDAVKENIKKTLGDKAPQFIASVASLVSSNKTIGECTQKSILSSCLIAASLDLTINQNLGLAYIIPYKQKDGSKLAQFQMGWKGFVQLAIRTGQFKTLGVSPVWEGDTDDVIVKRITAILPPAKPKTEQIGFVSYFKLLNGFEKSFYMSNEDLRRHAGKYSQSFKRNSDNMNLWRDDFDVMAAKTVIKQLLSKYAPMSIEMEKAIEADQATIDGEKYLYPDNQPIDANQAGEERERARILAHIAASTTIEQLKQCGEAVKSQDKDVLDAYTTKEKELLL